MTQQLQTETDCALVSRLRKHFGLPSQSASPCVGRPRRRLSVGLLLLSLAYSEHCAHHRWRTCRQNDLMNTDEQGRTNLQFVDRSTLDIGPGSDVRIDRFVYNPNRTTAGTTISLVKGVMRYDFAWRS